MNLIIGRSLIYEEEPMPNPHGFFPEVLTRWFQKASIGAKWEITDWMDEGNRGWFEFKNSKGAVATIFIRYENFSDLVKDELELTFNMLGPFSMKKAAEAANQVLKESTMRLGIWMGIGTWEDVAFWHQWLFDESSYGDALRQTGRRPRPSHK